MVKKVLNGLMPSLRKEDNLFRTRQIQRSELPWIRTRHIWTGTLGTVYGTFLGPTGIYFTFFCFASNMTKYQLGLMASLIGFAVVSQLFSWMFEDLWGNRKYPWYIFSGISRLCFLPIVFSFWIPLGPVGIIVLCVVSSVFANLATPPWSSWLYDLIPEEQLANFMAKRSAFIQLFMIGLALFAAMAVQHADEAHKMEIVRWVFGFGLMLGIIDLIFHVKIPEPNANTRSTGNNFMKVISEPWRDKAFARWMIMMSVWAISVSMGGPFMVPYLMKDLGFEGRFFTLTLITVCLPQMCSFVALLFWGRIIQRLGKRKVFALCYGLWSTIPAFYLFSRFWMPTPLVLTAWIIAGVFVNGAGIVNLAIMSGLTRGKKRSTYLAVMTITSSVAGGLGTLIGSFIVKYYSIWNVFPISLAGRIISLLLIYAVIWRWGLGDDEAKAIQPPAGEDAD